MRRDGYMCQHFKRYGRFIPAVLVHHVFPREEYPDFEWADWNLIALSFEAHNKMHDRITDDLTEEGVRLLWRTAKKYNIEIPERYRILSGTRGGHRGRGGMTASSMAKNNA